MLWRRYQPQDTANYWRFFFSQKKSLSFFVLFLFKFFSYLGVLILGQIFIDFLFISMKAIQQVKNYNCY